MTEPIPAFRPARNISARIVDGQLIILKPGTDELLRFNEVASFIWSILEKQPSALSILVEAIVEEFEVDFDQAEADLSDFLTEMQSQGLIEST